MKKVKLSFIRVYLLYVSVLTVLTIASIIYVNALLHRYEELRPEQRIEEAIEILSKDAKKDDFFFKYNLSEIQKSKFEENIDVKKQYLSFFIHEDMSFYQKSTHKEDELLYVIENAGTELAEVRLKAIGPAVTKLTVLNFREWQIEEIRPLLEPVDYSISVPLNFNVCVNDIVLTKDDGIMNDEKKITYSVQGVYLEPKFDIRNQDGQEVSYEINKNKVIAEFYDYTLNLPDALTVSVNGSVLAGEEQGNNMCFYNIQMLEKPEVVISDYYGNSIRYEGENEIPLTYMTVLCDSRYSVTVEDISIAKEAITVMENKEYEQLVNYVDNLPQINEMDIAILKKEADIVIADELENNVNFEQGAVFYDFTDRKNSIEIVPEEVSTEIDILEIAQAWSLFMSNDKSFSKIEKYLMANSYQYNVAAQYAKGVDITFMSAHSLANPAFTENSVTNFVWITDNCFSVDVSFVKHMIVGAGKKVDDSMNDRFYFVKHDDTEDGVDNPMWKIVSMKEIVNNGK